MQVAGVYLIIDPGAGAVRFACFSAADAGGRDLATGGDCHCYFWRATGGALEPAEPLWGAADPSQRLLCGAAVLDRIVIGTRGGHLYVWKDRRCVRAIRAHERGLETVHAAGPLGAAGFATGGADGFVKLWTARCVHVRYASALLPTARRALRYRRSEPTTSQRQQCRHSPRRSMPCILGSLAMRSRVSLPA